MIPITKAKVMMNKWGRQHMDLAVGTRLWELYEQEQNTGMMQFIRTLVAYGLDEMYRLKGSDSKGMHNFINAECSGLDIWEGFASTSRGNFPAAIVHKCWDLRNKPYRWWDIGKCGGFYRMFGTFFEYFAKEDQSKTKYKYKEIYSEGVDSFKLHTRSNKSQPYPFGKWEPFVDKGKVGKDQASYRSKSPRARDFVKTPNLPETIKPLIIDKYGGGQGITLFTLQQWSTIKKIDALFGLPEGADISGTTCDHIWGIYYCIHLMEQKGARHKPTSVFSKGESPASLDYIHARKPLIILLPLAQMVPQYHHALLETAAALSLNDFIDYKIGFYSSLIALNYRTKLDKLGKKVGIEVIPWNPVGIPIAQTVKRILKDAELTTPQIVCCHYTDETPANKIVGYQMDLSNSGEVQKFKSFARLGVETYGKFYKLSQPKNVTLKNLKSLLQSANLMKTK